MAVRLSPSHSLPSESLFHQQSARTCGRISSIMSSDSELVDWSEMFFFIVDSPVRKKKIHISLMNLVHFYARFSFFCIVHYYVFEFVQDSYTLELIVADVGKGTRCSCQSIHFTSNDLPPACLYNIPSC